MNYKFLKSFKIKNYKCFLEKNPHQGFEEIKPVNIIIGKNNSGKSKIIEYLKSYVARNSGKSLIEFDNTLLIKKKLEEQELKRIFRENNSGAPYAFIINSNQDHWQNIGRLLVEKEIVATHNAEEILNHGFSFTHHKGESVLASATRDLKGSLVNPFYNYECLSIQAERDLKKEPANFGSDNFTPNPDGRFLTEIIVRCLNSEKGHESKWQQLIETTLLDKINSVIAPDLIFTRIDAKVDSNDLWEVFLEEKQKGGVKLSDCGSGIKTIIFVMVMLYVAPFFLKKKHLVFLFEELENNLHPSLERRLLAHIRDYILENPDSILFLTTHSNVVIDMFSTYPDAQISRAYNNGEASFIEKVDNWDDKNKLLNDLGVRASDLLQSNCIVWLEGPSDRIYLKKWIELFDDAKLEEGLHYQCVFYGGAILSHFTAEPDKNIDDFIQMLKVNRNAILIMDSDKSKSGDPLKPRVERIIKEVTANKSSMYWLTEGREIENYLPKEALFEYFGINKPFKRFDIFSEFYKKIKKVKSFDKVQFAEEITSLDSYTKENLSKTDLPQQIEKVIKYIRACNS